MGEGEALKMMGLPPLARRLFMPKDGKMKNDPNLSDEAKRLKQRSHGGSDQ
jgi:hypothetical protein